MPERFSIGIEFSRLRGLEQGDQLEVQSGLCSTPRLPVSTDLSVVTQNSTKSTSEPLVEAERVLHSF